MAIAALAAGAVIFFLIPRFNAGYLSGFNLQPSLITGFSDDVELGQIGEIKKSSAVVMRITVHGNPLIARNMHWRGIALTTFDGRRWYTESHDPAALGEGFDGWITVPPETPVERRYSLPLAIYGDARAGRFRRRLRGFRARAHSRRFFRSRRCPAASFAALISSRIKPARWPILSTISKPCVTTRSPSCPKCPPTLCALRPRLIPKRFATPICNCPSSIRASRRWPRQITARARNPYDKARAVESYLRNNYGYTLDLSGTPPTDPLAYFLFQKRAGHCEYFAAAMTVMMRSLGIPARYINGFLAGEYNDVGGDYIVRASDAHSWVEVYFPRYGWITFDPTPPSSEVAGGVLSQLGLYWDWFQLQWSEWVVNYDFVHQFTLAQGVQRVSRRWTSSLHQAFDRDRSAAAERVRKWATAASSIPAWAPILLALLAIAVLLICNGRLRERLLFSWKIWAWKMGAPKIGLGQESSAAQTASLFYQRMLRQLERAGCRKSPCQTPLEFAASLPAREFAAPASQLTESLHGREVRRPGHRIFAPRGRAGPAQAVPATALPPRQIGAAPLAVPACRASSLICFRGLASRPRPIACAKIAVLAHR